MQSEIYERLLQVNRQFYQRYAASFAATRQRLQPGVERIMQSLPPQANILDLGCGNGEFIRKMIQCGFSGFYTGLDFSPQLLEFAQKYAGDKVRFIQADLADEEWVDAIPQTYLPFDYILAFAVLHHLPGEALRVRVLRQIYQLLKPGGKFIHSEWQFLNSPRLAKRVQPWESIGLNANQVDPGDYLIDWRGGGAGQKYSSTEGTQVGLRYVHLFDEDELARLADQCGCGKNTSGGRNPSVRILQTFYSDGMSGNLGLYQIWEYNEGG